MRNFTYQNPVRIHFGTGQVAALDAELPRDARVLLAYGGGSILANGVHAAVRAALGDRTVVEFAGIEANPDVDTLARAIEVVRRDRLDFLLAVGGGSVLDGVKLVAAAVGHDGDPWDLVIGAVKPIAPLPIGAVMTLPATGSEMNGYTVISRRRTREKRSFGHALLHPRFAVLDPAMTRSLPARQIANGIVDAFVHVIEQYVTFPADAPLQDRFAEGILLTLRDAGPVTLRDPADEAARGAFVWSATLALNGLIGAGVPQDWATHQIGHELTALYGLDHARTLALVLPALLQHQRDAKRAKLAQYATRVWDVTAGDEAVRADAAIARTRDFFEALGVPTRLGAYPEIGADVGALVADRLEARGAVALGERKAVTPPAVREILALAR